MGLPSTRDITILSGSSQIPANLLNDLQDCCIALKHGPVTETFFPFFAGLGTIPNLIHTDPGIADANYLISTGATNYKTVVPTKTGDRITALSVMVFGDTIVDCTWTAYRCTAARVITAIGAGAADNNRAGAWGTFALTVTSPPTMAAGDFLMVNGSINGANYRIQSMSKTWDRL